MIENNQTNRSKYFQAHHCQYIRDSSVGVCRLRDSDGVDKIEWIQLKSMSKITLEHAKIITDIFNYHLSEKTKLNLEYKVNEFNPKGFAQLSYDFESEKKIVANFSDLGFSISAYNGIPSQMLQTYDFLRSENYAVPYMGLTLDELVEFGWLKISYD